MADRLDPIFVRTQIEALRVAYPEIWDDGDEALLADMLEAETGLHEFLTVAVARMREAEAFRDGIAGLIHDLSARARRYDDRYEAMRSLAFRIMTAANVRKVELTQATLSIRAGQPKVIVTDEAVLPDYYVRTKREPNKAKLRDDLLNGYRIAGASLSNVEPVLAVRVK